MEAGVGVRTGTRITSAAECDGRALLALEGPDGGATLEVDHVMAATGYKVDLGRLAFLDDALRPRIRTAEALTLARRRPAARCRVRSRTPGPGAPRVPGIAAVTPAVRVVRFGPSRT